MYRGVNFESADVCSNFDASGEEYFKSENIVKLSHQRGCDELIHRSIKELATKE